MKRTHSTRKKGLLVVLASFVCLVFLLSPLVTTMAYDDAPAGAQESEGQTFPTEPDVEEEESEEDETLEEDEASAEADVEPSVEPSDELPEEEEKNEDSEEGDEPQSIDTEADGDTEDEDDDISTILAAGLQLDDPFGLLDADFIPAGTRFTVSSANDIQTAINSAAADSEITLVASGDFSLSQPITVNKNITVYFICEGAGEAKINLVDTSRTQRHFNINGGNVALYFDRIVLDHSALSDNSAAISSGGGIDVASGADLYLEGAYLSKIGRQASGGAIRVDGSLTIADSTIERVDTGANGGAIYVSKTGNLTVAGTKDAPVTIKAANAPDGGGAIYIASGGSMQAEYLHILSGVDNADHQGAQNGGRVGSGTGGGIHWKIAKNSGPQSLTNSIINDCLSSSHGAAVYISVAAGGVLNQFDKNSFNNNFAAAGMGTVALVNEGTVESFTANTFTNNFPSIGMGLYVAGGSGVTVTDTVIDKNPGANSNHARITLGRTNRDAGGIYSENSNLIITGAGTRITNNVAESTTAGRAGGIYVASGKTTMNAGSITGNTAMTNGGGVYVAGGEFVLAGDAVISGNTAPTGGGVYVAAGTFTQTGGMITGNTATGAGGGVALAAGAFNMSGGTISGNNANGGGTSSGGGGVWVNKGTFTQTSGTISGNTTAAGGGGVAVISGTYAMNGSEAAITGNTATGNGGGVYLLYGKMTSTGGTISGNKASLGGGVHLQGNDNEGESTFQLKGLNINNNTAASGGGVYANAYRATTYIKDSEISANKATSASQPAYGGGVYINLQASLADAWQNTTISGNTANGGTASSYGGGLYIAGSGTITFGGVVANNRANNGGGIYSQANLRLQNASVSGNTAVASGGGLYLVKGTTTQSGGQIAGNTAGNNGGGLFLYSNSRFVMKDGAVVGVKAADIDSSGNVVSGAIDDVNTAAVGGGIYLSTGALDLAGTDGNLVQINGNEATTGAGGGIYVRNGVLDMVYANVQANTAKTHGGGIYLLLADTSLTDEDENSDSVIQAIKNNRVAFNTAGGSGGGFYIHIKAGGVSETIEYNEVDHNLASGDGGGVYLIYEGTGKRILYNKFHDNEAAGNGGGLYITGRGEGIADNRMALSTDEVYNNTAAYGGGMYLAETEVIFINIWDRYFDEYFAQMKQAYPGLSDAQITAQLKQELPDGAPNIYGNKANNNGGGVYLGNNATLRLRPKAKINGNMAEGNGGGVYSSGTSQVYFESILDNNPDYIEVNNNTAGQNGGGMYMLITAAFPLHIEQAEIYGNKATKGDGGGIWVLHSQLAHLTTEKVVFYVPGQNSTKNLVTTTAAMVSVEDEKIHKANIKNSSPYFPALLNFAYNNNDISYTADVFTVMFAANGGMMDNPDNSNLRTQIYTRNYTGGTIAPTHVPAEVKRDNASFLGWFTEVPTASLEKDLSLYKDARKVPSPAGTAVASDLNFYAGWLFAPTIDNIYAQDDTGAKQYVTGMANPGSEVTLTWPIGSSPATATIYTDPSGRWSVEVPGTITLIEGDILEANQSYPAIYTDGGATIYSPDTQAVVHGGYKIIYQNDRTGDTKADGKRYSIESVAELFDETKAEFRLPGFELEGWSLSDNATTVEYELGGELEIEAVVENEAVVNNTIVLNTVWDFERYTITYEPGSTESGEVPTGDVPEDTTGYTIMGSARIRDDNTLELDQFVFNGWKGENGEIYEPDALFQFADWGDDITMTAQWWAKSRVPVFDVIYDDDTVVTGAGVADSMVVVYFPDGSEIETQVEDDDTWSVEVPEGVALVAFETVLTADQLEVDKALSDLGDGPVITRYSDDGRDPEPPTVSPPDVEPPPVLPDDSGPVQPAPVDPEDSSGAGGSLNGSYGMNSDSTGSNSSAGGQGTAISRTGDEAATMMLFMVAMLAICCGATFILLRRYCR